MELLIKQRVFSWTDHYDVYDQSGQAKYEVCTEFLTLGHQIHVYDKATGAELGSIHQKILTFLPQFEIVMGGRLQGTVRREFSMFTPRYQVDFRNWQVSGDFLGWDYRVMQGNLEVLSISKEPFRWGDTYVLRFDNPADEMPGLLLVLAIDAANCDNN